MSKIEDLLFLHAGPPVNVEAIISGLGIELDKKAILDTRISGELSKSPEGHFRISVNGSEHYYRKRFTMAHELGHFLLHADLIGNGVDDNKAYRSSDAGNYYNLKIKPSHEAEANAFAAKILMPKAILQRHAVVGASVDELAKQFQVSKQAMEIRLHGLAVKIKDGLVAESV